MLLSRISSDTIDGFKFAIGMRSHWLCGHGTTNFHLSSCEVCLLHDLGIFGLAGTVASQPFSCMLGSGQCFMLQPISRQYLFLPLLWSQPHKGRLP